MASRHKRKRNSSLSRVATSNASESPSKRARLRPSGTFQYVEVPSLEDVLGSSALPPILDITTPNNIPHETNDSTRELSKQLADLDIEAKPIEERSLDLPEEEPAPPGNHADLPIRYLEGFTVFDGKTNKVISLDQVEDQVAKRFATYFVGYASVAFESTNPDAGGSDSESGTTAILIKSSPIKRVWTSRRPEQDGQVSERSTIWLETAFAWYILLDPSQQYREIFLPRWLSHQIFLSMVYLATMRQIKVDTVEKFHKKIMKNEAYWAAMKFGRAVNEREIEAAIIYAINHALGDYEDDDDSSSEDGDCNTHVITQTPLFRKLITRYAPDLALGNLRQGGIKPKTAPGQARKRSPSSKQPHGKSSPPKIIQRGDRSTKPFCTPLVKKLVGKYFPGIEDDSDGEENSEEEGISQNFDLIDLRPPLDSTVRCGQRDIDGNLAWIEINGQRYKTGDTILVRPRNDSRLQNRRIHPTLLPDYIWFAYIVRLFGSGKAHVLWFEHAAKSSLNELAHPQELLLLDHCDVIEVDTIIGKCNNRWLSPEEEEPLRVDPLSFFYRYIWLRNNDDVLLDAEEYLDKPLIHTPRHTQCPSCNATSEQEVLRTPQLIEGGVRLNNIDYHIYDFVYILPDRPREVYLIGQITSIDCDTVEIRKFSRAPQPRTTAFHDERLLIDEDPLRTWPYPTRSLEGKCMVFDAQEEADLGQDEFYCHTTHKLRHCSCWWPSSQKFIHPRSSLKAMDLFSGAGAFSLGFEATKSIETRWAVDIDPSATLTFRDTHPHCTIYNTCINSLLRHTHQSNRSKHLKPLKSIVTGKDLPAFPKRGEVDIIFGGPPCQGFTALNRFPKANDSRNYLILSFLSAVDMLRPRYVVIENVRGLLSYRLGAVQQNSTSVTGGVTQGMMKLIRRVLMAMNYQIRYGLLQAANYGVPQDRRRIIFLAAARTSHLPDLPQPSHIATGTQDLGITVNTGDKPYSFKVDGRRQESAPLESITVMDAIGDLPQWEWINPHRVYSADSKGGSKMSDRLTIKVEANSAPFLTDLRISGPRNSELIHYAAAPLNRYQESLRGDSPQVSQHWCPGFLLEDIERICSLPIKSGRLVDHNDLPEKLRIKGYGKPAYNGYFGRLSSNGSFMTIVGSIAPNSPNGRVVHPKLNRVITIREMARAQGIPDSVTFQLSERIRGVKAIMKQIGNAVPVPMAAAIGVELLKAETRLLGFRRIREESVEI